jgi:hypothetical protein
MTADAAAASDAGATSTGSATASSPASSSSGPTTSAGSGSSGSPDSRATSTAGHTSLKGSAGDAFDEQGYDAYAGGRQVLSPSAVTVTAARDAQINIQSFMVRGGVAPTPGPVRQDQLDTVRARYVEVPEHVGLTESLRSRHLLVLIGPPGTGRSTTALHLLDLLAEGAVSRLDADPHMLDPDQIERGRGYLGELARKRDDPSRAQADRLADALERCGAYCVLVAPPDGGIRSGYATYAATCTAPDPQQLLAQHIDAQLTENDPDDTLERLVELAGSKRFVDALGPAPRPHEVAGLAGLLVAHGRGELTEDQAVARTAGFLEDQIAEWLSVLHGSSLGERAERARRLTAFRIATAVFDGMPRHYAAETAEALAGWMAQPPTSTPLPDGSQPPAPAPRTLTRISGIGEEEVVLDATRVRVDRDFVRVRGGAQVPASVLRFRDPRTPVALLRQVWDRHLWLRGPMVAWLECLARDPRRAVRVRAAQAAGLLCSFDFSHTFSALVLPAAEAEPARRPPAGNDDDDDDDDVDYDADHTWRRRREFAAVALDHAARDQQVEGVASTTLRGWRRSGSAAVMWTAAAAWGLDLGRRDVALALDELRIIGTPQEARELTDSRLSSSEEQLIWIAGQGIARLFATGAHDQVVAQLSDWIGARRRRRSLYLLAVQAIVYLAHLSVSQVGRAEDDDSEGVPLTPELSGPRAQWPVLLALHDTEPQLAGSAAQLLRAGLRSPWGDVVADTLAPWLRLAERDPLALTAVESILPFLVREPWDRAQLRSLVERRRRAWADALSPDIADRLKAVLDEIDIESGRRAI